MLQRLRRPATLAISLLLLATLSACGDDSGEDDTLEGLSSVDITGDPGAEPKVEWKGEMSAGDIEAETLVKGDGAAVEDGQQIFINYWVGNGFTQKKTYSSYDEAAQMIKVSKDFSPLFAAALEDQTIGSRVAVTGSAEEAFGEAGNPALGIGNKDAVLLILDITSGVLDKPQGKAGDKGPEIPVIQFDAKGPSGLDFSKVPEPSDRLGIYTVIQGTGEPLVNDQTVVVNYLGQVYDGKKKFDDSYSKGEPLTLQLGAGGVIEGWDKGLEGINIGSRVILAIPPKLGYGEKGNEGAGIKGTDTLYFVIDVLGAA